MKILIAGDYCPRGRLADLIEKENFAAVFAQVRPLIKGVDYAIVNFECPILKGVGKPIVKQGSNLKCSPRGLAALKWAGFNCVALANNHFLDYGEQGVNDTLESCKDYGMDFVGGGRNIDEASKVLYKTINGKVLAVVNCCEHEFSIATDIMAGSNPLNPVTQYYTIKEAKTKADYVLVIVHGGHEFFQFPSLRMQETYRFFIDTGADAVVNHHQHCYSGYEFYHDKPIFYGLGNFCFDNPKKHSGKWTEGYMVCIDLSEKVPSFSIYPYNQCGSDVGVFLLPQDAFDNRLSEFNSIIADDGQLKETLEKYYNQCKPGISAVLSPIGNHYYQGAISKGWVPSFVSSKRKLRIENITCCEAHRDKLQYYFNKRLK